MRMGESSYPERLSEAEYVSAATAIQVFRHALHREVSPHWHEFYELAHVLTGEGVHIVNGVAQPIRGGSTALLTPTDVHALQVKPPGPLILINVVFRDEALDSDLRGLVLEGSAGGSDPTAAWLPETTDDFERLRCEAEERRIGHGLVTGATLERLLVDLMRHRSGNHALASASSCRGDLRRALRFIEHHFRESITLADAAAQAHLSPNYFSTLFRQSIGMPFQSYLQDARLRFAATLLQSTDLAVTDVCHASGFRTLSHFERLFKQRVGQTPSRYRWSPRHERPSSDGRS